MTKVKSLLEDKVAKIGLRLG